MTGDIGNNIWLELWVDTRHRHSTRVEDFVGGLKERCSDKGMEGKTAMVPFISAIKHITLTLSNYLLSSIVSTKTMTMSFHIFS